MLSLETLNRRVLEAEYAVRGPIVQRAQDLEAQGRKIIYCNIGNPQALKQKPLTYLRQILSLLEYPELLKSPEAARLFPADVIRRVQSILALHPPGTGAYTQSAGMPFIRKAVAEFITRRDGIPSKAEDVILTDGASKGVQAALIALVNNPNDGVMIPIPQYPLYSASITLFGGRPIGYQLDEQNHWQLNEEALNDSFRGAKQNGTNPVAIAVINPGNPTGAVLSQDNIRMIVKFAAANGLAILADEVYQENVYATGAKFFSFAKTFTEMEETRVPLFSFHSISKGFWGECGHRGGYTEFRNIPPPVMAQLIKLQSISLCANTAGQLAVLVMVDPPKPGDESYALYVRERDSVLRSLKEKAELLARSVNQIRGMSVEVPQGAMYAFVKFELPPEHAPAQSVEERLRRDAEREDAYCLSLLEETGICVVPGSGFGQAPGTLHFRTTFLPPLEEIESFVARLKSFHEHYVRELIEA
jgi:aspartate/methionine/tyrosine aminotransferase